MRQTLRSYMNVLHIKLRVLRHGLCPRYVVIRQVVPFYLCFRIALATFIDILESYGLVCHPF